MYRDAYASYGSYNCSVGNRSICAILVESNAMNQIQLVYFHQKYIRVENIREILIGNVFSIRIQSDLFRVFLSPHNKEPESNYLSFIFV